MFTYYDIKSDSLFIELQESRIQCNRRHDCSTYLGHGIFIKESNEEVTSVVIPNFIGKYIPFISQLDTLWILEREWLYNSSLPIEVIDYIIGLRNSSHQKKTHLN